MFTKRFLYNAALDFATSMVTGVVVYVASDGDLSITAMTAAALGIFRGSLAAIAPRFVSARDRALED